MGGWRGSLILLCAPHTGASEPLRCEVQPDIRARRGVRARPSQTSGWRKLLLTPPPLHYLRQRQQAHRRAQPPKSVPTPTVSVPNST